jgi:RecA/RadA recombinase
MFLPPGYCAYLDIETAMEPSLAELMGVNTENILISCPIFSENLPMIRTGLLCSRLRIRTRDSFCLKNVFLVRIQSLNVTKSKMLSKKKQIKTLN